MNQETFLKATGTMAEALRSRGAVPVRNQEPTTDEEARNHLLYMCERADTLYQEGRHEKAMRWLGFIQGFFWGAGLMTIGDLREVNRPETIRLPDDDVAEIKKDIYETTCIQLTSEQLTELCRDPEAKSRYDLGDHDGFFDALLDALTMRLIGRPWPSQMGSRRNYERFHDTLAKAALAKGYTYVAPQ